METLEPKPISMGFWAVCIVIPLIAVGGMVWMLVNPDSVPGFQAAPEPINISFTVPGEFQARSLSDFKGRVIVVTLLRTGNCPECADQLAAMNTLTTQYGRQGLMSIALTEQDTAMLMAIPGLREMPIMAGHIDNGQAQVLPKERPFTYIIDRAGMVRKKAPKGISASKLEGKIEQLLGL